MPEDLIRPFARIRGKPPCRRVCESLAIRYRACETFSAETDPQGRDMPEGLPWRFAWILGETSMPESL